MRISYDSLLKYLEGFEIDPERILVPTPENLTVEIRLAEMKLTHDPKKRYLIVFIFDKERRNRLQLLSQAMVEEVVSHMQATGLVNSNTVVMLVGKEGSRERTLMLSVFHSFDSLKLIIYDFDGKVGLIEFIRGIASDVDRVEARNQSLQDPGRLDLTSLPTSEKRLRITDEESKQKIVFANQLMQIPGISEKVAIGIADYFQLPSRLMEDLKGAKSVNEIAVSTGRGESKRLNARVRSSLAKVFDYEADPNDSVR